MINIKKLYYVTNVVCKSNDYRSLRITFIFLISSILNLLTRITFDHYLNLCEKYSCYLYILLFPIYIGVIFFIININLIKQHIFKILLVIGGIICTSVLIYFSVHATTFTFGYSGLIVSKFFNITRVRNYCNQVHEVNHTRELCKRYPDGIVGTCKGPINLEMVMYAMYGKIDSNITDYYYKNVSECFGLGFVSIVTFMVSCFLLVVMVYHIPDMMKCLKSYCTNLYHQTSILTSDIEAASIKIDQ